MNDQILNPDSGSVAFGRYLKSMRTQMGIPIETVADEIRVSVSQLSHIEAEDHQQLPDAVYVKGIIRAYAGFIGIDEDDIVDRYDINRSTYEKTRPAKTSFFYKNIKIISLMGVFAVLFGILIVLSVYMRSGSHTIPLQKAIEDKPAKIVSDAFVPGDVFPPDPLEENESNKLFLKMDAVEDTTLEIVIDDSEPVEYLLHPMDHMELEACSKICLKVGNAAGVKVLLNDKPVVIPGKSGDVAYIELPQSK